MVIEVSWLSQAGTKTEDNRDYAGIGIRDKDTLCIVLDGSTTGANSGELARELTRELIDWYVASDAAMTAEAITARLRQIHELLSQKYPEASTSYLVLLIGSPNEALILHAGDCMFGRLDGKNGIEWLSQPHTLANATGEASVDAIADIPARHRLTRSFRAREFMLPEVMTVNIDQNVVLATDGFWAELDTSDQLRFMEAHKITMPDDGDDRSVLRIELLDSAEDHDVRVVEGISDNLHVKRALKAR
jgi:serine/threonine protein phosphatase PrpC